MLNSIIDDASTPDSRPPGREEACSKIITSTYRLDGKQVLVQVYVATGLVQVSTREHAGQSWSAPLRASTSSSSCNCSHGHGRAVPRDSIVRGES